MNEIVRQTNQIIVPNKKTQCKKHTCIHNQGDVMNDIWQQEKNLTKAAKVLGELKSHLHTRESAAKTKVKPKHTQIHTYRK